MHKFGLKLWSTNEYYLNEAVKLYQSGIYDYIELFVVPGSFSAYSDLWAGLEIPYIIHAPHFDKGVNLASGACLRTNLFHAEEAIRFADKLKVETIIFHPGIEGDVKETVRQLKQIADARMVVENKPYYGLNDVRCVGSSPEEIELIMTGANVGFCLDIGHAICAANAIKAGTMPFLAKFLSLHPRMFHLTDGLFEGIYDRHDHLGKGDYPIGEIFRLLPNNCVITVETDKDCPESLDDFAQDVAYLKHSLEDMKG